MLSLALNDGKKRPAIFMDCGIHAREWVSPAFCLHAIRKLLADGQYGQLRHYDFHIIPVANPDGYVFTAKNRMWRKNRVPQSRHSRQLWNNPNGGFGGGLWGG